MRSKDTYKEVITFEDPRAIVRVHIPDLTEEERSRRIAQAQRAAADLLKTICPKKQRAAL